MFKCKICQRVISNKGGLTPHEKACEKIYPYKEEIIKFYNEDFLSLREVAEKFNVGTGVIKNILGENVRTLSEGSIIAHKKYPEVFKHSEKSKSILRAKRLEYMKNNPEKTSWRTKNISYPEKLFLEGLTQLEWDKKYSIIRELSIFPYFIDFAFINEMVAIEIDGSQHLLAERKENDKKKDNVLIENNWTVIRISEKEVKKNLDETLKKIELILISSFKEKKYEFGILELPKSNAKKIRLENGLTQGELNRMIKNRKIERPPYIEIKNSVETIGYMATGKLYGVSDNAIRKWLNFYLKYDKSQN